MEKGLRKYSKVDLLRFAKFSKENEQLKPIDLIKGYDEKYPELSSKEKLINLAKGLRIEGLYKAVTGESLPESYCTKQEDGQKRCELQCNFCKDFEEDARNDGFNDEPKIVQKSKFPNDLEVENWFNENIGIANDCSASSAIYKFRLWLQERG